MNGHVCDVDSIAVASMCMFVCSWHKWIILQQIAKAEVRVGVRVCAYDVGDLICIRPPSNAN